MKNDMAIVGWIIGFGTGASSIGLLWILFG